MNPASASSWNSPAVNQATVTPKTLSSVIRFGMSPWLNCAIATCAPLASGVQISNVDASKATVAICRNTSSARGWIYVRSVTRPTMARCWIWTPLGVPVDPEV